MPAWPTDVHAAIAQTPRLAANDTPRHPTRRPLADVRSAAKRLLFSTERPSCHRLKAPMQRKRLGNPALAIVFSLVAAPLAAQVIRLPAVVAGERASPVVAASYDYPDLPVERLEATEEAVGAPTAEKPQLPVLFRPMTIEWLPRDGDDGVGVFNLSLEAVAVPVRLLLRIPADRHAGLRRPLLRRARLPELPARVYDAYAQFRWMRPIGERLGIDVAVTPGVYSDFHESTATVSG